MYSHSSNHFSPPIAPRHLARHSRMGCLHLHVYAIAHTCICNCTYMYVQSKHHVPSSFSPWDIRLRNKPRQAMQGRETGKEAQ